MRVSWRHVLGFFVGAALSLLAALALGLIPTHAEYFWEIGKGLNWISPAITAIATGFIAWFTFTLKRSTDKLWSATQRSAVIAERALTQLERPFIGIKIEKTGLMNLREGTDHEDLIFRLVNYGRAPAIITQLFDDIVICQCGSMPNPCDITTDKNEIPTGFVIGADKEAYQPSTRTYREMFSDIALRAFTMGTDDVFFIGFVRYRDIGNRKYRTGFCMKWSVPGDKEGSFPFLFIGEDGYNYTREET
jgi:hypothetical protein